MKKAVFIIFIASILLCSCSRKEASDNLEFPKTKWGMSMEETLDAYGITKKDTSYYREGLTFIINDYELFGEKTSKIIFNFIDLKNGKPILCAVRVFYPDSADMNHVLKKMQKAYGKTVPEVPMYSLFQTLGDELPEREYTESEHLKLWANKSVIQSIPENERENYRDRWKDYQSGLKDENWEEFSQNARMVNVIWSDDGVFSKLEKNALDFNAFNLELYKEIKNQLSDDSARTNPIEGDILATDKEGSNVFDLSLLEEEDLPVEAVYTNGAKSLEVLADRADVIVKGTAGEVVSDRKLGNWISFNG